MSAAVPKTHCHVMILVFPVTLLFVLHAYATDLNGAWANDPNVCAQIFVRKNNKTLLAEHADLYGRGLIFDGDQVTDQLITCRIKDRKTDSNTVRLLADCSTDLGKFTSRLILRIDDDNRLTRFLNARNGSGLFSLSCIKVRLVQIKTPLEMSVWANRREDTGTRRVS
jgi:hypothetical protein